MDLQMAKILITQYVRPKLEYAAVVWNPHHKKDITRRVPGLQGLTYEERLEELGITTLEKRRERGDAINMYNCVTGKQFIDKEIFVKLSGGRTRGHRLKGAEGQKE